MKLLNGSSVGVPPQPLPLPPLHPVKLPFYEEIQELLPPTLLSDQPDINLNSAKLQVTLPPAVATSIENTRGSSAMQIQLRLFERHKGGLGGQLVDQIPANCIVKVGTGKQEPTMPSTFPNPYPSMPRIYKPFPIDITAQCRAALLFTGSRNKNTIPLTFSWGKRSNSQLQLVNRMNGQRGAAGEWMAGVWVVRKLDTQTLFERTMKELGRRWKREDTLEKWVEGDRRSSIGSDGLSILCAPNASLMCPYTMKRIVTPTRPSNCSHLQCFDLYTHLAINEMNPKWQCPVCNGEARYSQLKVDEYFLEILAKADGSVTRVELRPDGSWAPLAECNNKTGDEDDDTSTSASSTPQSSRSSSQRALVNISNTGVVKSGGHDQGRLLREDSSFSPPPQSLTTTTTTTFIPPVVVVATAAEVLRSSQNLHQQQAPTTEKSNRQQSPVRKRAASYQPLKKPSSSQLPPPQKKPSQQPLPRRGVPPPRQLQQSTLTSRPGWVPRVGLSRSGVVAAISTAIPHLPGTGFCNAVTKQIVSARAPANAVGAMGQRKPTQGGPAQQLRQGQGVERSAQGATTGTRPPVEVIDLSDDDDDDGNEGTATAAPAAPATTDYAGAADSVSGAPREGGGDEESSNSSKSSNTTATAVAVVECILLDDVDEPGEAIGENDNSGGGDVDEEDVCDIDDDGVVVLSD